MGENSGIEWTDHTFNPWMGCTKVSPACKFCYAERDMDHRYGKVKWGPSGSRVLTSDSNWQKPLRWDAEAKKSGIRYRVFCASLADVFEDWQGSIEDHKGQRLWKCDGIDTWQHQALAGRTDAIMLKHCKPITMGDVRRRLFDLIDATPNLDWLLLTKRPENIRKMWLHFDWQTPADAPHRKNVWLGTSLESHEYIGRLDFLLSAGALASKVFISAEPLLDSLPTLSEHLDGIDWVIAGGESGPEARPTNADWFRSVRDQCELKGVPFFFKQWGEWNERGQRTSKKANGRILNGVTHDALPE